MSPWNPIKTPTYVTLHGLLPQTLKAGVWFQRAKPYTVSELGIDTNIYSNNWACCALNITASATFNKKTVKLVPVLNVTWNYWQALGLFCWACLQNVLGFYSLVLVDLYRTDLKERRRARQPQIKYKLPLINTCCLALTPAKRLSPVCTENRLCILLLSYSLISYKPTVACKHLFFIINYDTSGGNLQENLWYNFAITF